MEQPEKQHRQGGAKVENQKIIVMKNFIKTAIIVLLAVVLASCEEQRPGRKDRSMGGTAEILVVTQNDDQWKGRIGDSIRHFFLDYQYGLPQPEARNDLAHVNVAGFSDLFMRHKNILEVEINPSLEKAVATTAVDQWAAPQRYVKISAPNITSWVELFDQQKEVYQQWFDKVERERILNVFRPTKDEDIAAAIAKRFGFTLVVPQGFFIAKDEADFMWLRKEQERSSACIVIYQTPYKDTIQFSTPSLVAMRDMKMQQYIPGPLEDSYMATETEFVPPLVKQVKDYPAGYTVEMRGMWRVVNDYMGGPFVSYTFADSRTGNLVTVEGYYYEPNQKKRNMLLQLESIAYSLKFVEQ
jgi:hypothetical protein